MSAVQIQEIPYCDPVALFETWQDSPWAMLLHSAMPHPHYGRYSYIAVEPFQVLRVKDGRMLCDGLESPCDNPLARLKELLATCRQPLTEGLPPFQGGVAGCFSYDLYQYLENIPMEPQNDAGFPDLALGFYDTVIAFDHQKQQTWLIATGWPEPDEGARRKRAQERLADFMVKCRVSAPKPLAAMPPVDVWSSHFDAQSYAAAVRNVMDYIRCGDVFQANISQRFCSVLPANARAFDLYRHLQQQSPAPFSAFCNLGDFQVVSASPERFLSLDAHGQVETRPIKGTRARSADAQTDRFLADELLSSAKDRAENIMIVDLMRNDLSRVCRDHSVAVKQLCTLESYANVHHLVSVVTGQLRGDQDAVDLLAATFPGGSVTGAPKIRAMQVIAEMEPDKRGLYCGSLGYIAFHGAMDTSIAIRGATIQEGRVTFQAGGAVVLDSDPDSEYQETLVKSSALRRVLTGSV